MPGAITVTLDLSRFNFAVARLKDRAPRAIARALNRAAVSTRTVMVRRVAQDVGLSVGRVKQDTRISDASSANLTAKVIVRGARIPLMAFRARQTKTGVSAKLPGGAGRYPHAFIATMSSGHQGVFQRHPTKKMKANPKRAAIVAKFGPSIAHVFNKHREAGMEAGEASLVKNLTHELRFALTDAAQGS